MNTLHRSHLLILFLMGALCWTGSAASQTAAPKPLEWRDFTSTEGGFSIKFPGTPRIDAPEVKVGPLTFIRHAHLVQVGESNFEIDYMDLPAGSDPDAAIEGGVINMINSAIGRGSTVISSESVTRGNCNAREVMFSVAEPGSSRRGFINALVLASGLRMYTLVFAASPDTKEARSIGRTFVDSFTVTGGCTSMIAPADAPKENTGEEHLEGTADTATGWRIIENNDLGVRVMMPGGVRHITEKQQSTQLQLTHHTFIYSNEGSVYSAEVFGDYPSGWHTTPASYQTSLDLSLYALKKNLGSIGYEITPVRDLKLATNPGREFSLINATRGSHGRAQIYVTAKRIYVFMAFTRSDNPLTQISQFFSSVRISPK